MLNLLISRNYEANMGYIYNNIRDNLSKGIISYLFVPDQYTLLSDINLMNELDLDSIIDVKIKSFTSFSNEILELYGGIKRNIISDSGKSMLIKSILIDNKNELKFYSKNIGSSGFVSELIQTIDELKENNINPEDLLEKIKSTDLNPGFVNKIRELAIIYKLYNEKLVGHYIDNNDRLEILIEKLDDAKHLKNINFYFTNFHDLNEKEIEIIEKLLNLGCNITFSLILDPKIIETGVVDTVDDGEIFITTFTLYNRLIKLSKIKPTIIRHQSSSEGDISKLANNIFSYKPATFENTPYNISLFESDSTENEVRFIAETIKKHIIEDNLRYSDFSVITTDESEYDRLITRIFYEEDIPVFLDRKKKLTNNPLAKFLLAILNLRANKLNIDDVMQVVKFCFNSEYRTEVELFEKFVKTRRIRDKMYFNDKYFEMDDEYFENLSPKSKENAIVLYNATNMIRKKFLELISDYYLSSSEMTINKQIENLFNLLTKDEIINPINQFIKSQEEYEELNSENTQVWDMFVFAIDQLAEISGEQIFDNLEFSQLLRDGLEDQKIGIVPPSQDVVLIGSILRTRANNSKIVFIVGLNDLYLPRKIVRAGIISDDEKELLKNHDIVLPIKEIEYRHEEMLSIYLNILRAKTHLYLSRSNMNSSNEVMTSSIYYNQVLRIFPNILKYKSHSFLSKIKYSKGFLIKSMINHLKSSDIGAQDNKSRLASGLYSYLHNKEEYEKLLRIIQMGFDADRLTSLKTKTSESIYSDLNSMSISRIQTYSRCPYKHFIRYVINPEEQEPFDIDYFEIGNLAHNVMSKYIRDYKKDPNRFINLKREDFNEIVEVYLGEDIDKMIDSHRKEDSKNQVILEVAKKSIALGAFNVTKHLSLSSFETRGDELVFGDRGIIPGLIIEYKDKRIVLEGIIDRVDTLEVDDTEYVIVMDYKTGMQAFNLSFALSGIEIQPPIYLKAYTESGLMDSKSPAGFFYLPIREELINTESDDEEAIMTEVLESLMMDGVVIKDKEIIKSIDDNIDTRSSVIRFRGRKRDILEKDNVLDKDKLNELLDDVINKTKTAVMNIMDGDIRAVPYIYNKVSECTRCDYGSICKFSLKKDKTYRSIKKVDWQEYKVDDDGN